MPFYRIRGTVAVRIQRTERIVVDGVFFAKDEGAAEEMAFAQAELRIAGEIDYSEWYDDPDLDEVAPESDEAQAYERRQAWLHMRKSGAPTLPGMGATR